MNVSANTLFHFTDKKENLKGILKNYFYPTYSLEDLGNVIPESKNFTAHVPMVCFCDLIFSQIIPHIDFYGDYGIGLRKKGWGIENGISPIIYVPKEAMSATLIHEIRMQLKSLTPSSEKEILEIQIPDFYKYIKAYEGLGQNKRSKKMEFRPFYNEREWRFSPMKFRVYLEKQVTDDFLKKQNGRMRKQEKLIFKAKDIRYIIVKDEDEIPEFVDFIERNLKKDFAKSEIKLLVSKLISVQQIRDDM